MGLGWIVKIGNFQTDPLPDPPASVLRITTLEDETPDGSSRSSRMLGEPLGLSWLGRIGEDWYRKLLF